MGHLYWIIGYFYVINLWYGLDGFVQMGSDGSDGSDRRFRRFGQFV